MNDIDYQELLKESILTGISSLYNGCNVDFSTMSLVLGLSDVNRYNNLYATHFEQNIEKYLNNQGYQFREIHISNAYEENWTSICDGAWMYVSPSVDPSDCRTTAEISIYKNKGSMLQEHYILEANIGKTYEIGRGTSKRVNDIVIDGNPQSTMLELNKYVRSAHAHIAYQERDGFVLYADPDGTPQNGSRTRIVRQEKYKDITSPLVPLKLQDGDIIELAKSVLLIFNYTK